MFFGVHLLLFSRDVLEVSAMDAGEGWLIFKLPPAEMGVHPADTPAVTTHAGEDLASATVYLMCENLNRTIDLLSAKGVEHTPIQEAGWGVVTSIVLPGGGKLGIYQPRHPLAITPAAG
jgi:hypothetical protein